MSNKRIEDRVADNIRLLAISMVEKAKSGHPGGAMGGADFINILYSEYLNYDPNDLAWVNRDRFYLDPGHMSPMLYAQLVLIDAFSLDDIKEFRQWKSLTPGHPEVNFARGIENTSGPLGQGHTMAVGAAITQKFLQERFGDWTKHNIYTFISDGGIQEEISQGAGRIAGYLGLDNLIMFYDSNDIQLSTETNVVTSEDTAKKYESWGWSVMTIDGNNPDEIRKALDAANAETEKPFLIIGKTIMGKGLLDENGASFEAKVSTHGQPISAAGASFAKSVENLGGNPENPFEIFEDVAELYAKVKKEKSEYAQKRKAEQAEWEKANPELAAKWEKFFSNEVPEIDYSAIEQKPDTATRVASSTVLATFAEQMENMIVSSADLANSDKTDGFLKKTKSFTKGDFSGQFLQSGVAELTMASIANGMALHGGVIPVVGTFFVFSDYMKPAIRIAALQELPVKYVWTHDAFRVGEDGPTHQPIEQEAQIRLMERVQNHSGKNSMLVVRPADANETTVAWKMAMENTNSPTGIILSRQNVKNLPDSTYQKALGAERGAYVVKKAEGQPDVIMLANGSEVSTLFAGAELLEKEGIKTEIVSVISEGIFNNQDEDYKKEILPANVPKFGLTAGLTVSLESLVKDNGTVWGLNHFGYSAPFTKLDKEFGFNAENVYNQVKLLLKK